MWCSIWPVALVTTSDHSRTQYVIWTVDLSELVLSLIVDTLKMALFEIHSHRLRTVTSGSGKNVHIYIRISYSKTLLSTLIIKSLLK